MRSPKVSFCLLIRRDLNVTFKFSLNREHRESSRLWKRLEYGYFTGGTLVSLNCCIGSNETGTRGPRKGKTGDGGRDEVSLSKIRSRRPPGSYVGQLAGQAFVMEILLSSAEEEEKEKEKSEELVGKKRSPALIAGVSLFLETVIPMEMARLFLKRA